MTMKSYKHILAAAALTALTACTSEDNTADSPKEPGIPIRLSYTTATTADTRAAQDLHQGTFDADEQIMVRIHNESNASEYADYIYTAAAAGAMTAPIAAPEYPTDGSTIKIYSWYPCTDATIPNSIGNFDFTVKTDQTADADYKASDLMSAKADNLSPQAEPVELAYTHHMAKINVNITTGTGIMSINSVKILNVKPTHRFKVIGYLMNQAKGDPTTITVCNGGNGAALIPPQELSGDLLQIVTDKGTATYTLANPKTFISGKQYTLNITVSDRAVNAPVNTTNVITGWSDNGTAIVYTPGQEPLTVRNATADNLLWLITSDGYVYENYATVQAAGKTPVALICYVGEPGTADASGSYRGLAMALGDAYNNDKRQMCLLSENGGCIKAYNYECWGDGTANDPRQDMNGIQNTYAWIQHYGREGHGYGDNFTPAPLAATDNNGTPAPSGTSGWFLPSIGQWHKALVAMMGGEGIGYYWETNTDYQGATVNARLAQVGLAGTAYDPAFKYTKNDAYCSTTSYRDVYEDDYLYTMEFYYGAAGFSHVYGNNWVRSFLAF